MEPRLRLTREEQSFLAALASQTGFDILMRIAKAEVDKFTLQLLNTPADDKEAVLSAHLQAKTAAQLLTGFAASIDNEIYEYTNTPRLTDRPKDFTEGILDMDDIPPEEIV